MIPERLLQPPYTKTKYTATSVTDLQDVNNTYYLYIFYVNSDSELQVIDYKTQQYKLLPGLAMAYATRFAFDHVWSLYHETQKQIRAGNLSMLPQVKAIFFALKLIVERFKDQPFDLLFLVFLVIVNVCVFRIMS